jgi:hypothetical protein
MLSLFFSFIGIGLVIGIITLPFVGLFVVLKGRKEFSCLSCGMLSRRYPPLSMGTGFRMRCGYCGQPTLIPSNLPAAQQVMAGSVTPLVTPFVPPVPLSAVAIPNPRVGTGAPPSPRRMGRAGKLATILGVIFLCLVLFVIFMPKARTPDSPQSAPNATTAKPVQPAANNSMLAAPSADAYESSVKAFTDCLVAKEKLNHYTDGQLIQLVRDCGNEWGAEDDACIAKLGDPVACRSAVGLTAKVIIERDEGLMPAPSAEPAQPTPDNSTAVSAQSEAQQSAPPEAAPALSFQPSPESTDVSPAPVASQQETSGSPSAPQATEVTPGQTPDQVVAILGPPISITTGPTPVYNYPHLSIVFARGKVWKIHQFQ